MKRSRRANCEAAERRQEFSERKRRNSSLAHKGVDTMKNFLRLLTAGFLIAAFSALSPAQEVSQAQTTEVTASAPPAGVDYRIGIGDVLRVSVVKQDLLSVDNVRVSNEGAIRLPMLADDIPAVCLTEAELAAKIGDRYKKYLLNPQVYIAVKEFNSNSVAFVGAVLAPGRFQIQRPTRLLELLTYVNGPAPNAGEEIQIVRNARAKRCELNVTPNGSIGSAPSEEIITLPLTSVLKGDENFNPYVLTGDVIRISEAEIRQAFVIGAVKSAAIINLKDPVTLTKALAMAGGAMQDAQIEKIKISRQLPHSLAKTEIIVNLKEINKRKQEDVLLEPNDIVDVAGASGTRKLLKDIFRATIPAVTRAPIFIP